MEKHKTMQGWQDTARNVVRQCGEKCNAINALPHGMRVQDLTDEQRVEENVNMLTRHIDFLNLNGDRGRVLKVTKNLEREVKKLQHDFGEDKVLGCLGQLLTVQEDTVAHLISAFCTSGLRTLIVRDSETMKNVLNRKGGLEILALDFARNYQDRAYTNAAGKQRQYCVAHHDTRLQQFPWINDQMVVNYIEFRNPEHDKLLRFTALAQLISNHIVVHESIIQCVDTKKRMRRMNLIREVGDIWSTVDNQRMKASGVAGGYANRAKLLTEIQQQIDFNQPGATMILPSPNETKPKIEELQILKKNLLDLQRKTKHLLTAQQNEVPDRNREQIEQLKAEVKSVKMQMSSLDRPLDVAIGGVEAQNGGEPPELTNVEILAPDHVLRQKYGALGGAIVADFNDAGVATLDRVQLLPGIGTMQAGAFVLRFLVVTPLDLLPLMRDSTDAGDASSLQIPDIFPPQNSGQ